MLGIGGEELIFVLFLALLVLGPERLPKVARDVGRFVGDLRRTSDELRQDFLNADKYLQEATEPKPVAPAAPAAPAEAAPESASGGPPGESAFDREMREARERLRET